MIPRMGAWRNAPEAQALTSPLALAWLAAEICKPPDLAHQLTRHLLLPPRRRTEGVSQDTAGGERGANARSRDLMPTVLSLSRRFEGIASPTHKEEIA